MRGLARRLRDAGDATARRRRLGAEVAPGVFAGELEHLRAHEWARSGDDVLWRRSKLGLHLDADGRAAVTEWMARRDAALEAPQDVRLG